MFTKKILKVVLCLALLVTILPNTASAGGTSGPKTNWMVDQYTKEIAANPQNADAYFNRAIAYGRVHDNNRRQLRSSQGISEDFARYGALMINDLTKAIQCNPNKAIYYYQRAHLYAREYDNNPYYSRKHAFADYSTAIRLDPENLDYRWTRAGICNWNQKNIAIADYDKILSKDPYNEKVLEAKRKLVEVRMKVNTWDNTITVEN